MKKHFLIPYIPIKGHKDPDFKEMCYGESGMRAKRLKNNLEKGSYLFFHTKIGSKKYITAYMVIDRMIPGKEAQRDPAIKCDGQNDDWLFIGNKNQSKRLRKPIPFNRYLADKLSLNINFMPYENGQRSELQVIGSATRSQRELSEKDVQVLLTEIKKHEENAKIQNSPEVLRHFYFYDEFENVIPMDEVHKIKEFEIQSLIRKNPEIIEEGLKVRAYEKVLPDGDRLDILFEAKDGSLIVAELKGPDKLTDEIPTQVASYAHDIAKEYPHTTIRKMIICDGKISPKLEKACTDLKIEIFVYGVKLDGFKIN